MLQPFLDALRQLGGVAAMSEIEDKVAEAMRLTSEQLDVLKTNSLSMTKFRDELNWTAWALRICGLVEIPKQSHRALTDKGWATQIVNRPDVIKEKNRYLKDNRAKGYPKQSSVLNSSQEDTVFRTDESSQWKEELISAILKIKPYSFELLCKNLLKKLGIVDIEVTSPSNDKGIDGFGMLIINDIVSFKIAFQCKRYAKSVSAPEIQKFQGAMLNAGVEKPIFITTGIFTKQAKDTAEKAPRIDLIDGGLLAEKMLELELGVRRKNVIALDKSFFEKFD